MRHRIKDIMETDFPAIDCDDRVSEVEARLADSGCNALPVLNPDFTLFGTISQQCLITFRQAGRNPLASHAWEICATRPAVLPQDATLDDALNLYSESPFKEMMVVDHLGRLTGMLTSERLLGEHLRQTTENELGSFRESRADDDSARQLSARQETAE